MESCAENGVWQTIGRFPWFSSITGLKNRNSIVAQMTVGKIISRRYERILCFRRTARRSPAARQACHCRLVGELFCGLCRLGYCGKRKRWEWLTPPLRTMRDPLGFIFPNCIKLTSQ
jgi:hypothetical protein